METSTQFLLPLGGILLLGLLTSNLARHTFLPRATLLLIFGILIGSEGLNVIPPLFSGLFDIIADMTLLMVGFLLGGKLTLNSLKRSAGMVIWISITAALVTALTVSIALLWLGVSLEVAIILGCIASATAPAATLDVVNEFNRKSMFGKLLLSIVALDDIWALVLFAFGIAIVKTLNGAGGETSMLMSALTEIGGAVLLGVAIGAPAAYLTGRVKKGQPILTEALGIVFICGGLAIWLEVSFLIAAMVMGAFIANFAHHHKHPFHAIEGIESNFMIVFFVLAGASMEFAALREIGLLGIAYIVCRALGKFLGTRIGSQLSGADRVTKNWMGLAMLPQAGVSIGMALVAANQLPDYRQELLSLVIASAVFFDIVGPVLTRIAMQREQKALADMKTRPREL